MESPDPDDYKQTLGVAPMSEYHPVSPANSPLPELKSGFRQVSATQVEQDAALILALSRLQPSLDLTLGDPSLSRVSHDLVFKILSSFECPFDSYTILCDKHATINGSTYWFVATYSCILIGYVLL